MPGSPLTSYPLNSVAPTVSNNLGLALRHARIRRAGVQPKSVREYAANAVYAKTERIEAVAEQLGVPSYDTTARLIAARRGWSGARSSPSRQSAPTSPTIGSSSAWPTSIPQPPVARAASSPTSRSTWRVERPVYTLTPQTAHGAAPISIRSRGPPAVA